MTDKSKHYLQSCPYCKKENLTYKVFLNHIFRHENKKMRQELIIRGI